jgi:hypothetical protein
LTQLNNGKIAVRSNPVTCSMSHQTEKEAQCCNDCQVAVLIQLLHEAVGRMVNPLKGMCKGSIVCDYFIGKGSEGIIELTVKMEKGIPFETLTQRKVTLPR